VLNQVTSERLGAMSVGMLYMVGGMGAYVGGKKANFRDGVTGLVRRLELS
jgi:hypothetical protein